MCTSEAEYISSNDEKPNKTREVSKWKDNFISFMLKKLNAKKKNLSKIDLSNNILNDVNIVMIKSPKGGQNYSYLNQEKI